MSVLHFLSRLEELGIIIELVGEKLKIKAPGGILNPTLINELKSNKGKIIEFLQYAQKQDKYVSLEPSEEHEYYKLSSAQKRMYFLQQMELDSTAYNMPVSIPLIEESNIKRLEEIFMKLIHRHESLRTSFHMIADEPVQRIHKEVKFEIEYHKVEVEEEERPGGLVPSSLESAARSLQPASALISSFIRPFDLSRSPLLRVGLIQSEEEKHLLMVDMHHIISDGVSLEILINDFMAVIEGEKLLPLRIRYKDFSGWQNQEKQKENIKHQEAYWVKEFGTGEEIPVLDLPTDYPRPALQSFEGCIVNFEIPNEHTAALKTFALERGTTLFMVSLAIFNVLLSKLSSQEDILVGTPISGRRHADLTNTIGMFVNTLVLRNYPTAGQAFVDFLLGVKEKTLEAFENQEYQFEDLVEKLSVNRDTGRNPLFDVMFLLNTVDAGSDGTAVDEDAAARGTVRGAPGDITGTAKFDLTLAGTEINQKLAFSFQYRTKLFKKETIERFAGYFKNIISAVTENIGIKLVEIEFIPAGEKRQLLYDFNKTRTRYPRDKTIQQLFEKQVKRNPERSSVTGMGHMLTYRELNEKSDQLAGLLREKAVKPDSIVGIMMEPSLEMITGILGILKAGGAYLPLDPDYPGERIRYMLADSRAHLLLTSRGLSGEGKGVGSLSLELPPNDVNIIFIDDFNLDPLTGGIHHSSSNTHHPENLAYVIYTSGTTGTPKGSLIRHRNVVQLMFHDNYLFDFDSNDVWTMFHSYCFDFSVWEIYGALLYGGKLVLIPKMTARDPEQYLEILKKEKVTILNQTPAAFYNLARQELKSPPGKKLNLKYVIFGGEALTPVRLKHWQEKYPGTKLINMFGITETTVHVTYKEIGDSDIELNTSNIGRPIPTLSTYVMDKNLKLVPIEAAGELCVGGLGVCRGYLNRPELTEEKFTGNPYKPGERLYRSGDLGRLTKNGDIQYLGRIDQQVKIRGYRIELGEIESRLLLHPEVKEAVVMARGRTTGISNADEEGDKYLCAYIVSGKEFSAAQLRDFLLEKLPGYMIPSYFIQLERFPLTGRGKIDRSALPAPGYISLRSHVEFSAPGNAVEEKLVEIWEQVLGRDKIGINDNFFELGGDSIKTIQVAARMNEAGYKVEVKDIFREPTISGLSPFVKKIKRISDQSVISGVVPLTPIQRWFFQQPCPGRHHFNQAVMLFAKEGFEKEVVEAVFLKLQEHHDALRMIYKEEDGDIIQVNRGLAYPISLQVFDYRKRKGAISALEAKADEIQASIHLGNGPLMKLSLFHLDDGDRLLIVIHHLVIDGVSWRMLLEDIETLYRQYKEGKQPGLPLKTDSFKLWSERLSRYANSKLFLQEKVYWRELESREVQPIKKDFARGSGFVKDTETLSFHLNEEETRCLITEVNKAFATGIDDILVTALGLGIKKTFGNERIVMGLESHGREEIFTDVNIKRTVGWFTSIYPIWLDFSYENSGENLSRQIKEVKESLRRVPYNGIGYGILKYLTAGKYKKDIDFKLNPQVIFNYLGQFDADLELKSFRIAEESVGRMQGSSWPRGHELSVSGMIANKRLVMTMDYSGKQFKQETIERLSRQYKGELARIISYCAAREERELTPSDLTYPGLSIDVLDGLQLQYPVEDIYTLTPMQEGMLFHALYDKTSSMYFEQLSYGLRGNLDIKLVEQSVNELFKHREVLRTVFVHKGLDRPVQVVLKDRKVDFIYQDIRNMGGNVDDKKAFIKEFKEQDRQRPFDLSKDVLMRVIVLQIGNNEYEFTWSFHHILMDGWCLGILIPEFSEIYSSLLQKRAYELPPAAPYRTFVQWLEKQDKQISKSFWEKYIEGYEETAAIPKKNPIEIGKAKYEVLNFEVSGEKKSDLDKLALQYQVTLNTVLQTVWGIILGWYNSKRDVIFGTVVSGRPAEIPRVESIVGLFINAIPVRIRWEEKTKFKDLLRKVQEEAIECKAHHYYPLAQIQSQSVLKQHLLDHLFGLENYPIPKEIKNLKTGRESSGGLLLELTQVEVFEQTNYDLSVRIVPQDGLTIEFKYNANLYDSDFVARIARHFDQVMNHVLSDEEQAVEELTGLNAREKKQVLSEFNRTNADYPKDKSIHWLFREQAERKPHHIAVVCEEAGTEMRLIASVTYGEINRKSDQLAHTLRGKGVGPDTIVPIAVESSIETIMGILGILKAGGAYLPVDADSPSQRIEAMLVDSGAGLLIIPKHLLKDLNFAGAMINLEDEAFYPHREEASNPGNLNHPGDLAYVIYTSGSTGQAKGVLIEHRNILNYIYWRINAYQVTSADVCLELLSLSFDASYANLYPGLLTGGKVVLLKGNISNHVDYIGKVIEKEKVTNLGLTPSLYRVILERIKKEDLESVRMVGLGGETAERDLIRLSHKISPHIQLVNEYGPTENSVATAANFEVTLENTSVIGKPISNNYVYILDDNQGLKSIGVPGELCISGRGLARGYLNYPQLTDEKFVKNVHRKGERMYRTGDLARWLPEGTIEFRGRIDKQIKIRGYRVELGEIENQLQKHTDIKEAVLIAKEHESGDKYLCAYITAELTRRPNSRELREYLAKTLPDYMIPAVFVHLETIPLTPSGKTDRNALPEPPKIAPGKHVEYAAPRNAIEKKLVETWGKVLGKNNIGIYDNFFMIGGDSIKSIQIASRMNEAGYEFQMKDLFQNPTIAGLSLFVKESHRAADQSTVTGKISLTPIQHWFFEYQVIDTHHFNHAVMLYWAGGFDEKAIKAVFLKLQQHHDVLRMVYKKEKGEIVQINKGLDYPLSLRVYDFRCQGQRGQGDQCSSPPREDARKALESKANEIQASIDLEKGPLMKLGLFRMHEGDRLLIVIHHLVIDTVSWRILFEDIGHLYRQYQKGEPLELPLKTDSFKQWSEKLSGYANSESFLKEKAYWAELEAKAVPIIKRDFEEEPGFIKDSVTLSFSLGEEETHQLLTGVNHAFGTEINDILLIALALGTRKTYGHNRVLIGLEGHGREEILKDVDINRTVGWFTTQYPVLLEMPDENDLSRQIKEMKECLRRVPYRGIGYGILKYLTREEHKKELDFKLNPQISINYLGQFDADVEEAAFGIANEAVGNMVSLKGQLETDFQVSGLIVNKQLEISIAFSKKQYKPGTVRTLLHHYKTELIRIISYCAHRKEREFTPSDFTYKELSIETVDELSMQYDLEDLYLLSPMQEGMLFHFLYDRDSSAYFEQTSYHLHGELNIPLVEKSLNQLFKRHDILRTVFIHEGLDRPIQVVLKDRQVDFYYEDIRELDTPGDKERYIKEFKAKDKQRSFDLSKDVLMRLAVLQTDDTEYEFIWSFYHILMDGWCLGILISDFFEIYNSYLKNRTCQLPAVKPYRTYIEWLEKQDREKSINFWTKYLEDYEEAVFIGTMKSTKTAGEA
ncbi:MAG: amino acid adenylation domain-containing protein, partial [Candidatus Aminicenantes bacterium]